MLKKYLDFLKNITWILPFIFFFIGYFSLSYFFTVNSDIAPDLIGMNLNSALELLSSKKLNLRVIDFQEKNDIEPDSIICQFPSAFSQIKINQSILITVSKKPAPKKMINLSEFSENEIKDFSQKESFNLSIYYVPNDFKNSKPIAQSPCDNDKIEKNIISYFSKIKSNFVIIPNLKNYSIEQCKDFAYKENLELKISSSCEIFNQENYDNYKIIDQQPICGILIDRSKIKALEILIDYF